MEAAAVSTATASGISGAGSTTGGATTQFITFTVGGEEFGVDIMSVKEIKGWTEAIAIPKSPEYVRGVINLRGIIVPIFDLRARFGQGRTELSKSQVIIIVTVGTRIIGLLVDGVSDILTVGEDSIRPVPDVGLGKDDAFLNGLVAIEDRMVTLISLGALFAGNVDVLASGPLS